MILECEIWNENGDPVESGTDVYITIKKVSDLTDQEYLVERTNSGVIHITMPIRANVWAYDWDIELPISDSYHIQFDYNGIPATVITGMVDPPEVQSGGNYAILGAAGVALGRIDSDGANAKVQIGNKQIFLRRK